MPIILQERDLSILHELAYCRFLTLAQISVLCFGGRTEAAKKRLQKLRKAGLIRKHSPNLFAFSIYMPASPASAALGNERGNRRFTRRTPSSATLQHEIALRDVRAYVYEAARVGHFSVEEFSIDSSQLAFEVGETVTRPDGYFALRRGDKVWRLFVEVDNGSEPYSTLLKRVAMYRAYFKTGGFANRCGGVQEEYRRYPFRLLIIFNSDKRSKALVAQNASLTVQGFVVVSSLQEIRDGIHEFLCSTGFHSR